LNIRKNNFLKTIIEYKKQEIEELLKENFEAPKIKKSFAFRKIFEQNQKRLILIAEFKKASPSAGIINENADLKEYITLFDKYADAISILTDEKFFSGNIKFVQQAKEYTGLPILAKDFYIHPVQIKRAVAYNADAILIIAKILNKDMIKELYNFSTESGIDAIVEVHSKEDIEKIFSVIKPQIIGINTRDLEDFTIHPEIVNELLPCIPDDTFIIAESGIEHFSELKNLNPRINGVLIGTSIMKSENPAKFLEELSLWCE